MTFWELTKTYTGLKLLSRKGRFNILDESQVLAVYCMPDGQVCTVNEQRVFLPYGEGLCLLQD